MGTRLGMTNHSYSLFCVVAFPGLQISTKTMHTSSTPNALAGNPFWLDVLESAHVLKSARVLAIIIIIKFYRTMHNTNMHEYIARYTR